MRFYRNKENNRVVFHFFKHQCGDEESDPKLNIIIPFKGLPGGDVHEVSREQTAALVEYLNSLEICIEG